ncbi:hypothetical protein COU75_01270 [Candidatus Peregrinibacteria bacterium CG10_big_fil_rev_8_21_14_0_10_42_8]|nr:MAG: hypothetical protein COU75_01270 [Candidatus Peregrinibacteria bacterium CG10_big_fil_rev_8_21_14_0_10_42_8]
MARLEITFWDEPPNSPNRSEIHEIDLSPLFKEDEDYLPPLDAIREHLYYEIFGEGGEFQKLILTPEEAELFRQNKNQTTEGLRGSARFRLNELLIMTSGRLKDLAGGQRVAFSKRGGPNGLDKMFLVDVEIEEPTEE